MPIFLSYSVSNEINAPSPALEYHDFDPGDEGAAELLFINYYGNQHFGWDVTFTMWEDDGNQIEPFIITSVNYLSPYDFISANNTPDNTVEIRRLTNPFNEKFVLQQVDQGSLDRDFTLEAQQHQEDFTFDFDDAPIDADTFQYYAPENELFQQKETEFDLQEIQSNTDIEYIGCSEWVHPDPKWLPLTHTFSVTGYRVSANTGTTTTATELISIYNEVHWDFWLSYETFQYLENNALNVDKDPVDGVPDDIEIVVPDPSANLTPETPEGL